MDVAETDPVDVIPEPSPTPPASLPRIFHPGYRLYRWSLSTPRRRSYWYKSLRALMVIGMLGLVSAILLPELTNTAQPAPDPLTTGPVKMTLAPYNTSGPSGLVDGDDVVAGNWSVVSPTGAEVLFSVLPPGNSTWGQRLGQALYALPAPINSDGVSFTAAYTDWYFFVWTNPYNETVVIYYDLNYLSSAPPA